MFINLVRVLINLSYIQYISLLSLYYTLAIQFPEPILSQNRLSLHKTSVVDLTSYPVFRRQRICPSLVGEVPGSLQQTHSRSSKKSSSLWVLHSLLYPHNEQEKWKIPLVFFCKCGSSAILHIQTTLHLLHKGWWTNWVNLLLSRRLVWGCSLICLPKVGLLSRPPNLDSF